MGGRHVAAHSRRRRLVAPTVIGVLFGLLVAPAVAGAAPADKVEICHFNADADPDAPDWNLLEIKNNKAVEKHQAHGDGLPGELVPGDDGFVFGAECELIPVVDVDVMSQNLYIGADLDRILQGEPPAAVLETVLATDYPGRAAKIAETIGANRPDLVGIQEATLITVFDSQSNVLLELDYLAILVGQLNAAGHPYEVSSSLTNADVTLPIDFASGVFARVVDRDAIIHNTATTTVANPAGQNFTTNFAFELGGFPIEFTRGFTGVDATVDGQTFRFVNTHLEVENAPCVTPGGVVICQDVQAEELIDALSGIEYPTFWSAISTASPARTLTRPLSTGATPTPGTAKPRTVTPAVRLNCSTTRTASWTGASTTSSSGIRAPGLSRPSLRCWAMSRGVARRRACGPQTMAPRSVNCPWSLSRSGSAVVSSRR